MRGRREGPGVARQPRLGAATAADRTVRVEVRLLEDARAWRSAGSGTVQLIAESGALTDTNVDESMWTLPAALLGAPINGGLLDDQPVTFVERRAPRGAAHAFPGEWAELFVIAANGSEGVALSACHVVADGDDRMRAAAWHPAARSGEPLLEDLPGDMRLPARSGRARGYWLGAPGRAWKRVAVMPSRERRVVRLAPGGAVRVENDLDALFTGLELSLELRHSDTREVVLRVAAPPRGQAAVYDGVACGRFEHRLLSARGRAWSAGVTEVRAGTETTIRLSAGASAPPPEQRRVRVSGRLTFPIPTEEFDALLGKSGYLMLKPSRDTDPRRPARAAPAIARLATMTAFDAHTLDWELRAPVVPGEYEVQLRPYATLGRLVVEPGEWTTCEFTVPEPARTSVRVAGATDLERVRVLVSDKDGNTRLAERAPDSDTWIGIAAPGPTSFTAASGGDGSMTIEHSTRAGWNALDIDLEQSARVLLVTSVPMPSDWWSRLDAALRAAAPAGRFTGMAFPERPPVGTECCEGLLYFTASGSYSLELPAMQAFTVPASIVLNPVAGERHRHELRIAE